MRDRLGFLGKLLVVDLSTEEFTSADLEEGLVRRFLGGRGLNAPLLARSVGPDTDPLAPENVLLISCGLLTGTEAPISGRLHLGARSPLTGLLGSSNVGGYFGAALRAAGVQVLLIRGRAGHPVSLSIDGDRVALRDASSLWGLGTRAAAEALRAELGEGVRLMVIGPGGEHLVRYACVMSGTRHAAGRTGLGAVMGSKQLKAITVRGGERPRSGSDEVGQVVREYVKEIRNAPRYDTYARFSNSAFVRWADESGILATRNYQQVHFEGAGQIDGRRLIDYVTRSRSCYRCPVHCKAEVEVPAGRYAGTRGERPDIEPIVNLGSKCGLDDPEALLYLYNLAGTLGIDAISCGGALAFAMELFQRGIISEQDTDGLSLTWGDAAAMETMMKRIALRQGFGDLLAEGVRRAAQIIGRGAQAYAHHSKGLELTAYDPRGGMGTALGYVVSSRGGDFTSVYAVPEYRWDGHQGRAYFGSEAAVDRLVPEGKGSLVRWTMIVSAVLDALGLCKVPVLSVVGDYSLDREAALTAALTGLPVGADDLATAGERIVTLERCLNLRWGVGREDDALSPRFTEDPVPDPGPTAGMTVPVGPLVRDFYEAMGWDEQGRPTEGTLRRLGLIDLLA